MMRNILSLAGAAVVLTLSACGGSGAGNNATSETVVTNEDLAITDTNDSFANDAAPVEGNSAGGEVDANAANAAAETSTANAR